MEAQPISLIRIKDPFHRLDRDYQVIPYKGDLLTLTREQYPETEDIVVSINGKVVPHEELPLTHVMPGDCVLFVPQIHGGGGSLFGTIAMIAVAAAVWIAAPYVASAVTLMAGGPFLAGAGATALGYFASAAFTVGAMLLGGMIVNALLPAPDVAVPSLDGTDYNRSNYYSWTPQTTQQQGGVIPKFYGQLKLVGNIISAYSEPIDDKNYLNVLIHLGNGPYKEITTLKINDQAIANFDNVTSHIRYGRLTQEVIPNFNDTKTEYSMNVLVAEGNPYTYRTIGDDFDRLEIEITFPSGLYYSNDQGGLSTNSVAFTVRAVGVTLGNYYDLAKNVTVSGATNQAIKKIYASNVIKDQYDITITRHTGNQTSYRYGDELHLTSVKEVASDDFTYPQAALVGLKALASDQLSGSLRFSCVAKTSLIRTYRPDEVVGTDGYNYRCKLAHTASSDNRPITGANWSTYWEQKGRSAVLNETVWSATTGGGAGTEYTATSSWHVEYNNCPAWVCYDSLTQPVIKDDDTIERYDGYNPSKLVTADFVSWANFCDTLVDNGNSGLENRFSFNGGFDSEGNLWTAANKIAQENRALLVWKGYSISVVIDQAASAVQMFSSGNINMDTFKETFLPMEDRAGEIEVSFKNSSKDYERDTFYHFNSTLNRPSNKVTAQLIGCTSAAQAWRYADYTLAGNQYWKRTIEFDVDVDALACTIGDVIAFQHDVPQWGLYGGRVVSATANTVTLDQTVTLAEGSTYAIMIRLTDDTLVTKTISSPAGSYTTLSVSTAFSSVPALYDPFALGVSGVEVKDFRVSSVSRTGDTTFTIEAIEYNANVYSCDSGTPVTNTVNYSSLKQVEVVSGLTLKSYAYLDNSGNTRCAITGSFTIPSGNPVYAKARIYYRKYLGSTASLSYTYYGDTLTNSFTIDGVDMATYYEVLVQSVGYDGLTTDMLISPSELIETATTIDHNSVLDYKIAGLQIFGQANDNAFVGKDCKFVWQPVTSVVPVSIGAGDIGAGEHLPPVWFKDYEVKIYDSTTGNLRRTEYVLNNEYTYTFEKNYEDTGTASRGFEIRVKARDRFYRVSAKAAILAVTNDAPDAMTGVTVTGGTGYYIVEFAPSADPDIMGYKVYASQTTGFTPSSTNLVNEGSDTRIVISPDKAGVWYVKVAAYDSFGDISLNYSEQYSVTVSKWVEYNDLELELMKMSFQGVSWAQFAVFDDFADETKRYSPEPSTYQCIIYKNSLLPGGTVAERAYGFWSKQYTNVTTVDSGTATSVGENFLTDTAQAWFTDECKNLTLVDSESSEFTVTSNTSDTLTISGTPAAGDYSLRDDNPAYMVCYCTYEDATYGGGTGYVKMEVSFDGGGHFTTVLDTLNSIDLLEGTQAIAYPGVNYIVRFTLTNDSNGDGPVVYKYLVCTDPSPWRF